MLGWRSGTWLTSFAIFGPRCGWFGERVLAAALYGVAPADPVRLLATTGGVMLVALVAIFVAVRGAGRLDPAALLREE